MGEEIRAGRGLVAVALPALLWVASAAFLSFEVAVNVAFDTLRERRFWLSRLKAFVSAACAAWLLAASALLPQVTDWLDRYRVRLGLPSFLGPGAAWVGSVLLAIVTFLVFAWLYKILPRGKVGLRHVSIAAAMALVLWEAARRLFSAVLVHSTAFGLLTGTVAGVAAFLLWVFLANSILLYGAEMAALLNGNPPTRYSSSSSSRSRSTACRRSRAR